jgi:2-keto-4-pentenoate hydratase
MSRLPQSESGDRHDDGANSRGTSCCSGKRAGVAKCQPQVVIADREADLALTPDIDELARQQLADYDAACPGLVFAEPAFHLTVPEAYELQFKVASLRQLRGESVAGYKVGCVSPAVQGQLGLHQPLIGHIFDTEVYRSDVSLDHHRFHQLAIEGEFAFRMAEDVPDEGWLAANAEQAIEAAFAVIELHNFCCRAPAGKRAQELIANNGMHAGVVLPEEEGRCRSADELLDEEISVLRDGMVLGAATVRALPDGPLSSLIFLVEQLRKIGKSLCRGQIVLAGSPLPLYRAEPGDRFEVNCNRLPGVRSRILS